MRKVKVAAVQMRCTRDVNANIANAEGLVRKAAADGPGHPAPGAL